jgi:chromosome segregation protein
VSAEARIAAATRQAADAAQRHEATARRVGELAQALDAARAELSVVEQELKSLGAERQDAAIAWEAARLEDEAARAGRDAVAAELSEVTLRLERARRASLDAETAERAASAELVALRDRVEERYQLDLGPTLAHLMEHSGLVLEAPEEVREPIVVGNRTVEKVEDRVIRPELLDDEALIREDVTSIEEHRAELSRIGDVNLTALEEYTELKARFDDLETQRADLQSSVDAIKSAIAKLNKVCRERFRETFDRVDETFRKAYPDLVGGGEARLELTQEEDLLETGVEIFVRPPGKRLQTLSLLSGGEKAMTAIALLLALFTVKPSPFCVLDEVDAPLDEANGARFNDMIRHMSKMTQFIVITHNRKTMECADTLYGITMPVPGCSTLVSVQIDGGTS